MKSLNALLIDTESLFHLFLFSLQLYPLIHVWHNFFCRLGHQFFFLACVPSPFTPRTNIKAILNYKATYTYDFSPSEIARFIDCHVVIVESLLREITGFLCLQKKIKSQKFDNANMYVV